MKLAVYNRFVLQVLEFHIAALFAQRATLTSRNQINLERTILDVSRQSIWKNNTKTYVEDIVDCQFRCIVERRLGFVGLFAQVLLLY